MMVGIPQGFDIGLLKFGKVDVVVDTISQKAYFHPPLFSQEKPLSMRNLCNLF
jgi:hypothetical protein